MLSNTYGKDAISGKTCGEWFHCFQNGDFNVKDRHRDGRERFLEDTGLEALIYEDLCQSQKELHNLRE